MVLVTELGLRNVDLRLNFEISPVPTLVDRVYVLVIDLFSLAERVSVTVCDQCLLRVSPRLCMYLIRTS